MPSGLYSSTVSAVTEEELRAAYDARIAQYTEEEKIQARHILIRVPANAPEADVKKAEEETSVFKKSKVGVLRESGEWDGYNKNEQIMIEYMSRLIDTYLETVKKNLMDSLPKVGAVESVPA